MHFDHPVVVVVIRASEVTARQILGRDVKVTCADVLKYRKLLVTANDYKEARVWDIRSGKQLHSLPAGHDSIVCMAFSPDGSRLAVGSKDHFITVWNTTDWKRIRDQAWF